LKDWFKMDAAPFSAPAVNTERAAVEGETQLPDGSVLIWGLSRKEFGPMSFTNRPEWDIASNRLQFLRLWNLKLDHTVSPILDHTSNVQIVTNADARKGAREAATAYQNTDALLTRDSNLVLLTTHADCLPVWLSSSEGGWIGMAHVGWRGLLGGIVKNLIEAVPESDRSGIQLAVGPGISTLNYEVGSEVADQFLSHPRLASVVSEIDGSPHLDLVQGVIAEGDDAGVPVDTRASVCTYDNSYLSSYRRDKEKFSPMAAFIVRLGGR
jgi:purine-nucleoside/S-methyl-5'-thioadenosine phosphorylase / adenosine deaminase